MRRPIVIGNWKMNGDNSSNQQLLQDFAGDWQGEHNAEVVVCPPFPYLSQAIQALTKSKIMVGAQDVSTCSRGAYTGDVCAEMLADLGCKFVIVGHSERRQYHSESSEFVADKASAALNHQLTPVVCVGETLDQREAGEALDVIASQLQPLFDKLDRDQLAQTIIAYEPLWAIGTGRTATPEQAQEVHGFIREKLGSTADTTRVLYGGSVKPDNAAALFAQPDIDGALVGGASLKADSFLAICQAAD